MWERVAEDLLAEIFSAGQPASDDLISRLETAAAYVLITRDFCGVPVQLSEQMIALLAWTQTGLLIAPSWRAHFQQALLSRPLIGPTPDMRNSILAFTFEGSL